MMTRPIAVLVVDDHPMFAQAIELLIQREDGLEILGSVGSAEEALEWISRRQPDVVLMDIDLPGMDGIEATRRIRSVHPDIQVVAVTGFHEHDVIAAVIEAGACGYVPKTEAPDRVLETVRQAASGEMVLPNGDMLGVLAKLRDRSRARTDSQAALHSLTPREREVLNMICGGKATAEIAGELFITPSTALTHVKNILGKLGVHSKLEAVTVVMRERQVGLDGVAEARPSRD